MDHDDNDLPVLPMHSARPALMMAGGVAVLVAGVIVAVISGGHAPRPAPGVAPESGGPSVAAITQSPQPAAPPVQPPVVAAAPPATPPAPAGPAVAALPAPPAAAPPAPVAAVTGVVRHASASVHHVAADPFSPPQVHHVRAGRVRGSGRTPNGALILE